MVAVPDDSASDDIAYTDAFDDAFESSTPSETSATEHSVLVDGPPVELLHPTLHTSFVGVQHYVSAPTAEVHQFRGIKYANVPFRFRRSVLFDKYAATTDATKFGPICPQIKNRWMATRLYGLPSELVPVQPYTPPADEFECCNLTITVPAPSSLLSDEPMPVMVWIHGGGNVTGSGNEWVWDMGALVKKSIEIGKPIVAVALNFRLGLFGFGASDLLREDNNAAGEEGVGNYGLHDQRTAFHWIRKYIGGFGGDPLNVTLFGSSWGAADIHSHLLSTANYIDVTAPSNSESDSDSEEGNKEPYSGPLFHRAILQSGALVPSSSVVQDIGTSGQLLHRIMSTIGAKTIEELRAVPAQKIVELTGERVRPVDDGVFLRKDWRTLTLPVYQGSDEKVRRRQDVVIGDVACESVLWATPARMWGADAVSRRARAIVQSVRRADALMRAYEIVDAEKGTGTISPTRDRDSSRRSTSAIADDDDEESDSSGSDDSESELAERVMELMNDVAFAWPVDVAARCAADSAFVFEEHKLHTANGHLAVVSEYDSESDSSALTSESSDSETTLVDGHGRKRLLHAPYVYRYVFDQASPYTGTPHHGVDLLYLFGNIPFPVDPEFSQEMNDEVNWDRVKVRQVMQERWLTFAHGEDPWDPLTPQPPAAVANMTDKGIFATPMLSPVSSLASHYHGHAPTAGDLPPPGLPPAVSPASSRSSSFSHTGSLFGELNANPFFRSHHHQHHTQHHLQQQHQQHAHHQHHQHHLHPGAGLYGPQQPPPISISESDKVYVFGPEGETGARSAKIFAGRRRVHAWREALAPLGLATAQKIGNELGNGPPM